MRTSSTYGFNGLDDETGEVEEEFGAFEDAEGCAKFLGFGGVLENWEEDLVCFHSGLWRDCQSRQSMNWNVVPNARLSSSRRGLEPYSV